MRGMGRGEEGVNQYREKKGLKEKSDITTAMQEEEVFERDGGTDTTTAPMAMQCQLVHMY